MKVLIRHGDWNLVLATQLRTDNMMTVFDLQRYRNDKVVDRP